MVHLQQGLRNPRFQFGLVIEFEDHAFGDLMQIKIEVGLDRDIDLRTLPLKPGEPRQTVQGLSDRIQAGQRDLQRALLLRLSYDLVDLAAELEIGSAEVIFAGNAGHRSRAARDLLHDRAGGGQPDAVGPMPVQARWVQIIVLGDLVARLAGGQPPVDLRPLDMLACATFSRHDTHPYAYTTSSLAELLVASRAELFRFAPANPNA